MDAKEAIYHAKEALEQCEKKTAYKQAEFYKVAIEALEKVETLEAENAKLKEKEIPKEPICEDYAFKCPSCKSNLSLKESDDGDYFHADYCTDCGQKICWY